MKDKRGGERVVRERWRVKDVRVRKERERKRRGREREEGGDRMAKER